MTYFFDQLYVGFIHVDVYTHTHTHTHTLNDLEFSYALLMHMNFYVQHVNHVTLLLRTFVSLYCVKNKVHIPSFSI